MLARPHVALQHGTYRIRALSFTTPPQTFSMFPMILIGSAAKSKYSAVNYSDSAADSKDSAADSGMPAAGSGKVAAG